MKIKFFTNSTHSDIQEIQSYCIKKHFPECEHHIIDGRVGWFLTWYKWLYDFKYETDIDYYIHVDEDCFINSREEILNTIDKMYREGYDIAGPPDGHHEYRSSNHMAINQFFMIVSKKCIDVWHNRKNIPQFKKEWIEPYQFDIKNTSHYEYDMEWGSSGKPLGLIWKPDTEPYYDFMWVLKDNGINFLYLEPVFGEELQTTNLLDNTIIHMWHQRERWSNGIVSTLHKMSNKSRFDEMIKIIKES